MIGIYILSYHIYAKQCGIMLEQIWKHELHLRSGLYHPSRVFEGYPYQCITSGYLTEVIVYVSLLNISHKAQNIVVLYYII